MAHLLHTYPGRLICCDWPRTICIAMFRVDEYIEAKMVALWCYTLSGSTVSTECRTGVFMMIIIT